MVEHRFLLGPKVLVVRRERRKDDDDFPTAEAMKRCLDRLDCPVTDEDLFGIDFECWAQEARDVVILRGIELEHGP